MPLKTPIFHAFWQAHFGYKFGSQAQNQLVEACLAVYLNSSIMSSGHSTSYIPSTCWIYQGVCLLRIELLCYISRCQPLPPCNIIIQMVNISRLKDAKAKCVSWRVHNEICRHVPIYDQHLLLVRGKQSRIMQPKLKPKFLHLLISLIIHRLSLPTSVCLYAKHRSS